MCVCVCVNERDRYRGWLCNCVFTSHVWAYVFVDMFQVASEEAVVATLQNWDLSATDSMLSKMKAEEQRRAEEEEKQNEAETDR